MTNPRRKFLFAWRAAIIESDLPADTKHVGLTLSMHMDERGGSCFPSLNKQARETSRGKRQVRDHLGRLEEDGFLLIHRGKRGRGNPNHYQAVLPEEAEKVPSEGTSKKQGKVPSRGTSKGSSRETFYADTKRFPEVQKRFPRAGKRFPQAESEDVKILRAYIPL
jgi:hypothetical protein